MSHKIHKNPFDLKSTLTVTVKVKKNSVNERKGGTGMKLFAILFVSFWLAMSVGTEKSEAFSGAGQEMDSIYIVRADKDGNYKAPETNFTGNASVQRLFPAANNQMNISGGYVSFEAGARTNWHTHPLGQLIIITEGSGRVQQWGGPMIEVNVGDVVWFPPNVKHWHGAAPNSPMTHISLAEIADGKSSVWMERVTDDQYNGK